MANTLVLGSTGMVGAYILSTLRAATPTQVASIATISRRSPPAADTDTDTDTSASASASKPSLTTYVDKDTTTWSKGLTSLLPYPTLIFSGLATTRAAAGGFENQYKLEHDLNIELARAAKSSGSKVYVLISANGASDKAYFNYSKMKGEIEEHVKELDFEHTVIVRPGLITGRREESRPAEAVVRFIADGVGRISGNRLKDFWAQDADVIARAAVNVGLMASRGEIKEKVKILEGADIIRYGRTEWKELQ